MFYITDTERDTWEVRNTDYGIRTFAYIIRWSDMWEVRDEMPKEALDLRLDFRAAIWNWIEAETKRRGEEQRPVCLVESLRWSNGEIRKAPESRPTQKEEMPVWML